MASVDFTDKYVRWESGLAVDADGSPNAYGPDNSGLDYTADAGSPGNWYGVVTRAGEPIVQGPNDPSPGKWVSTTALTNREYGPGDPRCYVNSETIRYLSMPSNAIRDFGLHLGDVGFAYCRHTGQMATAVIADIGPRNKYGEGSMALAHALGLSSSPRNGGTDAGVVVVLLKGTSRGWPRTNEDVAQQVQDWLNANPGAYQALIQPQS